MLYSPLRDHPLKATTTDLVAVEGDIDPAEAGSRMLIAPYHVHHTDDEVFYVRRGEIAFEIGDEEIIAQAGDAVLIPAGTIHTWWNPGSEPATYLIIMPRKLDDLINAIHERYRTPEEMAELFTRYDSTYIGWTR